MTPEERASDVMARWTTDDVKNHVRLAVAFRAAIAEEREACAKVVVARAALWRAYGGAAMAGPYGHLTVEGECDVIADGIRRR